MTNSFKISLAARCEAAGRSENEDNYQVAEDLSVGKWGFSTDRVFPIGEKGALLLVCDGMGGMNAGEVASAIGVDTIKNFFFPNKLTLDVLYDDNTICSYIRKAIIQADAKIKEVASSDSSKQGMGSTAVLAWIFRNKIYVGWCGDSRAYRYNPAYGLQQLSHDHSYVQDLVDTGKLSPDLAFDHPNKNIITRSLGDPRGAARPDVKVYDLQDGDVILLCSDGLSDSLRDCEIEAAIKRGGNTVSACRDALWTDSYRAGWHDNVTIVLARVCAQFDEPIKVSPSSTMEYQPSPDESNKVKLPKKFIAIAIVLLALIVIVVAAILFTRTAQKDNEKDPKTESAINTVDSLLKAEALKHFNSEMYVAFEKPYLIAPDSCKKRWESQITDQMSEAQWGNEQADLDSVKHYARRMKIKLKK